MTVSSIQILTAIAMLGVAVALFFAYRSYLARNSERRMLSMLDSLGLDSSMVTEGEMPTIMKEVRQRCRQCTSEDVCERWLAGEEEGDNAFCPNSRVFEILGKYDKPVT